MKDKKKFNSSNRMNEVEENEILLGISPYSIISILNWSSLGAKKIYTYIFKLPASNINWKSLFLRAFGLTRFAR